MRKRAVHRSHFCAGQNTKDRSPHLLILNPYLQVRNNGAGIPSPNVFLGYGAVHTEEGALQSLPEICRDFHVWGHSRESSTLVGFPKEVNFIWVLLGLICRSGEARIGVRGKMDTIEDVIELCSTVSDYSRYPLIFNGDSFRRMGKVGRLDLEMEIDHTSTKIYSETPTW